MAVSETLISSRLDDAIGFSLQATLAGLRKRATSKGQNDRRMRTTCQDFSVEWNGLFGRARQFSHPEVSRLRLRNSIPYAVKFTRLDKSRGLFYRCNQRDVAPLHIPTPTVGLSHGSGGKRTAGNRGVEMSPRGAQS